MSEQSPAGLVGRLAAGDDRALGPLYDAYGHVAYGLALAITGAHRLAEAVVSESFTEAYRSATSFDAGQTSVLAWLTAFVRRNALEKRKSDGRGVGRTPVAADGLIVSGAATPLGNVLRALTAPQRQVIELSYYRGFTVRQIAAHLGEPENGARELLRSAMQELRSAMSEAAVHEAHVVTRA